MKITKSIDNSQGNFKEDEDKSWKNHIPERKICNKAILVKSV